MKQGQQNALYLKIDQDLELQGKKDYLKKSLTTLLPQKSVVIKSKIKKQI